MEYKIKKITIIGLGYVGLPLALEFSKKYKVLGFDINQDRIAELSNGIDRTNKEDMGDLSQVISLSQSNNLVGLTFSGNVKQLCSDEYSIIFNSKLFLGKNLFGSRF